MVNSTWKGQCSPCQGLGDVQPYHFEQCQWQKSKKPHLAYLTYRWIIALQFLVTFLWSMFDTTRHGKYYTFDIWLVFLTNWAYLICVIQSLFGLWIVQTRWKERHSYKDTRVEIPRHYRVYRILQTLAVDLAIGVTIVYWSVVHKPGINKLDAVNFLSHALNSVFMVTDLWLVAFPCRLIHFMYTVVFGVSFTSFSYIYFLCGGQDGDGHNYIYAPMNWENPGKAFAFSLANLGLIVFIHFIVYGVSKLRCWFARPYFLSKAQPEPLYFLNKPALDDVA